MASSSCLSQILIICLATAVLALPLPRGAAASGSHDQALLGWASTGSGCRGATTGECPAAIMDPDESESEISSRRRALRTIYISYNALYRNYVVCSRRGRSYYNCYSTYANPYYRSCNAITRCRS